MALIVAITAVGSIVGLELIPRPSTHTVTAAHTTTVSTAAAAPVSTTTATRRRCDTWGNRDRCTDCYGPDRAWLGISAPANFPSQGLMLIARSKTRCPLQTDKGSDLVSACSGVRAREEIAPPLAIEQFALPLQKFIRSFCYPCAGSLA